MDIELYDVYNEDTERATLITRQQLLDGDIPASNVSKLINKQRRSAGDYILLETYNNEQSILKSTHFYTDKALLVQAFSRYITQEHQDIILNNGNQWHTDYAITSTFGAILRAFCPRCN